MSRASICRLLWPLALAAAGCTRQDNIPRMAILDATSIDAKGTTEHSIVVITGGRITAAGTKSQVTLPELADRVDAGGKFLVPAYVKAPADWPETPLTTVDEIDSRVNVDGIRVVFGIAQDRVIAGQRWFDQMRKRSVVFVPRISRLEPSSEPFRIASENLLKLAASDVAIAALAPRNAPETIFQEFEALAKAGLSPQQVLNAATLNAALAVAEDDYGLILADKRASLLLLGGNPMRDINNLSRIERVMVNGNWTSSSSPFVN